MTILAAVKIALRITTNSFDAELAELIEAGQADLRLAGIINLDTSDPLVRRAVITYCRLNFGQPDDYDRLKASYDEQKRQMGMATGYTRWTEA